jgi:nucleotide-binding universal stress UspA family protein/RimJ/RimL family protein N-acetyltransferase
MTVRLRDGSRVLIRPIEPDDRAALAAGFERLSAESRYRRFFAPMPRLRERDLDYLTRVDHRDHEALVAVDADGGSFVGVARYVRTGADVAEPAVVVADDWQGRGVGGALLDALAERARTEGVARFEAPVLAENREAIRLLSRLGASRRRGRGTEVDVTIELPSGGPGAGTRVRGLLGHFARGALEPARTVLEALWPRRREPGEPERNAIVVGTDGSEHARAAVAAAAELASASDATVDVVGAHRFLLPEQPHVTEAVRDAAAELRDRGLHVHEHLRPGDPALVLTDVAAEQRARLIVVGAGAGAAVPLLGTVADLVAARAPCDVLIARPGRNPT